MTKEIAQSVDTLRAAGDARVVIKSEGTSEVTTPDDLTGMTCGFTLVWIEHVQHELIDPLSDPQDMGGFNWSSPVSPRRRHAADLIG